MVVNNKLTLLQFYYADRIRKMGPHVHPANAMCTGDGAASWDAILDHMSRTK